MVEVQGVAFVARSAAVDYLKPARLDDLLEIDTRVASVGRAQVVFDQRVLRGAEILAQGLMWIACVTQLDTLFPGGSPSPAFPP